MKKLLKIFAMMALLSFAIIGCRSQSVYNVKNIPISGNNSVSQEDVYEAIKLAGASKGWIISKVSDGLAQGQINLRAHEAIVSIPYSNSSYSILYKSSKNLKYDGETIHSNYNGWVKNLKQAIDFRLAVLFGNPTRSGMTTPKSITPSASVPQNGSQNTKKEDWR
jgi:hypothetical protein